mmetsp:Transcript_26435/g.4591  ORF Transcript_26435/g.4591 Transcript_26435/m.4591 type:complete len:81 (-) Transcript_26435:5907-6149(-)
MRLRTHLIYCPLKVEFFIDSYVRLAPPLLYLLEVLLEILGQFLLCFGFPVLVSTLKVVLGIETVFVEVGMVLRVVVYQQS